MTVVCSQGSSLGGAPELFNVGSHSPMLCTGLVASLYTLTIRSLSLYVFTSDSVLPLLDCGSTLPSVRIRDSPGAQAARRRAIQPCCSQTSPPAALPCCSLCSGPSGSRSAASILVCPQALCMSWPRLATLTLCSAPPSQRQLPQPAAKSVTSVFLDSSSAADLQGAPVRARVRDHRVPTWHVRSLRRRVAASQCPAVRGGSAQGGRRKRSCS